MTIKIHEAFTPISEKVVRSDGTAAIKLIAPGWGSSGFYSRDVLERDIPAVFPAGTHMYWNHQTDTEERERPEGDLNDLAAVITSTPIWLEAGEEGPGMYADAKVFRGYAETLDEIAPHIGVSIRGAGVVEPGQADGREGAIIQSITMGKSVDFVTAPGAGGAIVQIFESAGRKGVPVQERQPAAQNNHMEEINMDELEEARNELQEARDRIAALCADAVKRDAADYVRTQLGEAGLPDLTNKRLARVLALNVPMNEDGTLNEAVYATAVSQAIDEAKAEIAAVVESNGHIAGHGEETPGGTQAPTLAESKKRIDEALALFGGK